MFSIFLEIKEGFRFSDNETKLSIFLLELEENEGLIDICKCHGKLTIDETFKVLSHTLQINEKELREILAPRTDLDIFGFLRFNQEGEMTLQKRCALVDLVEIGMRNEISDDLVRANDQIMQ